MSWSEFSGWMAWAGLALAPLMAALGWSADDADGKLVSAVLAGDATAYRGLVERYQGRVYSVVYGMIRNREDATDLTQETFVRAYQNLRSFRTESSFYTWIYRIAMNAVIDHTRRMKKRTHDALDEEVVVRDAGGVMSEGHHRDSPGKNLERKELHGKLLAALETLPEDQRQAIVLREVDGLSYKEIAEVMGIPEGTVMSRLFYARKKLQTALAEHR